MIKHFEICQAKLHHEAQGGQLEEEPASETPSDQRERVLAQIETSQFEDERPVPAVLIMKDEDENILLEDVTDQMDKSNLSALH